MLKTNTSVSLIFIILLVAATAYSLFIHENVSTGVNDEYEEIEVIEEGVYRSSAEGYGGEMVIEVQIKEDKITGIEVIEHRETEDFAKPAFKQLKSDIINKQSSNVDIVSGSTETSEAFIKAVDKILKEKDLIDKTVVDDDKIKSSTASAEGYGGEIKVEVEVKENEIIDINILEHQETKPIAEPAFEELKEAAITEQSPEVDTISGATDTSKAFKEALREALP